jgi:hypothetical protein
MKLSIAPWELIPLWSGLRPGKGDVGTSRKIRQAEFWLGDYL